MTMAALKSGVATPCLLPHFSQRARSSLVSACVQTLQARHLHPSVGLTSKHPTAARNHDTTSSPRMMRSRDYDVVPEGTRLLTEESVMTAQADESRPRSYPSMIMTKRLATRLCKMKPRVLLREAHQSNHLLLTGTYSTSSRPQQRVSDAQQHEDHTAHNVLALPAGTLVRDDSLSLYDAVGSLEVRNT